MNLVFKKFGLYKESQISKRLGFSETTKLLIIHADDFGLSESSNRACIMAFEKTLVTSGSIMVPCPSSGDSIAYCKLHPEIDMGIHLTLVNEWERKKWGPVLGDKVPSLTDRNGFFFQTRKELEKNARLDEVERELRAQIETALSQGLIPTHLDSHMFCCLLNPDFLKIYLNLGYEYGLKVLINSENIKKWFGYNANPFLRENDIMVEKLIIARYRHFKKGLPFYYRHVLQTLKAGLNCLLVHPAFDDHEMKEITSGHLCFNSNWRQTDLDFFTSNECLRIVAENNIRLTSWKEIKMRCE